MKPIADCRLPNAERTTPEFRRFAIVAAFSSFIFHPSSFLLAAPTLDQVFKSTNQQFEQPTDPRKLIALVCAVVGVVIVLVLLSYGRRREVRPKALNHPGKLVKEMQKQFHLRPAEVRQLKTLADTQQLASPLTLLLCPSVLVKAAKERPDKVDRRALASMIKRLG